MKHLRPCARCHVQRGGHGADTHRALGRRKWSQMAVTVGCRISSRTCPDRPRAPSALSSPGIERSRIVVGLTGGLQMRSEFGDHLAPCRLISETGHDETASVTSADTMSASGSVAECRGIEITGTSIEPTAVEPVLDPTIERRRGSRHATQRHRDADRGCRPRAGASTTESDLSRQDWADER